MPPLGLITLAAMLPKDWELRLVDRVFQEVTEDQWNWAEIVLISGMLVHKESMTALVREARARGKTAVVGGPYPSMVPEELIEAGAHFVFRGEAESGLDRLVQAIAEGSTGSIIEENEKPDLTTSPSPRFDLLDLAAYHAMCVQTNRGCPFECEFCDVSTLFGRKPRHKTPDQVIGELQALYDLGWRGAVLFSDDNFIGSKAEARKLLDALIPWIQSRGEPFSFWTQASVNLGQDIEMIDLMTSANFGLVFLGIETPDEETLIATRKLQNVKNPLAESVLNICRNGLSVVGSFIIGFDNEKPGADQRIIDFVNQTRIPVVMVNRLEAQPGTALWERLKREDRLLAQKSGDYLASGGNSFIPTRPSEQIAQELAHARQVLFDPSEYMRRAYEYYLTMRPTRKALAKAAGSGDEFREIPDRNLQRDWITDLKILAVLVWRRGIVGRHRRQFWTQLGGMWRHNRSRMSTYLISLVLGENLYPFSDGQAVPGSTVTASDRQSPRPAMHGT